LTERLRLPHEPVEEAVGDLTRNNLIVETADVPPCYVPSRALEKITLKEIIDATRTNFETDLVEKKYLSMAEVDAVTGKVECAINDALGETSLKDLVQAETVQSAE
jgi:membrane protein